MSVSTFGYYSPPGYGVPEAPPRPVTATPRQPAEGQSTLAYVREFFRSLLGVDLGAAADEAYRVYLETDDIYVALNALRKTDEYKARFAGLEELRAKGRPLSEAAYLDLERQYTSLARQFDLPPTFYDSPDDFARLIGGEVSPAEFQRRLTLAQSAERESRDTTMAEEINAQLGALGLPPASDGDFLAAFLDPQRGVSAIERRLEAARVGAESRRAGFGALTADEALGLTDLGVTQDRAREGFTLLSQADELLDPLAGEQGADAFTRQQRLSLVSGTDAASARRLQRRARSRTAEFEGGGGGSLGRSGLGGLG